MTKLPTSFNRWINDNNPPAHLEYGKGWWDYVEILQRLLDKFAIEEPEVVGTYFMIEAFMDFSEPETPS